MLQRTLCDRCAARLRGVAGTLPGSFGRYHRTMRLRLALLSIALAGATLALPAAAQWKWRGANGQIQYSDLPPPPGVSEKDILSRPTAATLRAAAPAAAASPAASGAAQAAKAVDPELEAKRKKVEEEKKATQKAEEEKAAKNKADNCTRARSYQRTLNDGVRITRNNAAGEREYLDDKARADEQRQVEDVIRNNCK